MKIQCHNCKATLKYPVYYNGVPYGADCAESLFGIRIPVGVTEIDKLVESANLSRSNYASIMEHSKKTVLENAGILENIRLRLSELRNTNEWEYSFLFDMVDIMGLRYDDIKNEWTAFNGFNLNIMSPKQRKIFNRIL